MKTNQPGTGTTASMNGRFHSPGAWAATSSLVDSDPAEILHCLLEREKAGATGFGSGVAIPHCRHAQLDRVRGAFVRLAEPVDYGAVDGVPVDLVFLLLSPTTTGPDHLKALAAVSRLLRDPATASKLRGARSSDALYALLTGDEARDAA